MVKPLRTGDLLARIRSALRNCSVQSGRPKIVHRNLEIDLATRTVKLNSQQINLTAIQYSLLALFGKNKGRILTHQYILREIWGEEYTIQLQYLRVYVAQLRKEIEKNAGGTFQIKTESGIGYRLVILGN